MSQITLPWIEKSPETLSGYRRRAIGWLLGLGVVHLLVVLLFSSWLEPWSADLKEAEWKIPFVWIGVIGATLGGLTFSAGALAILFHRFIGRLLRLPYVAAFLFFGGVIGVCLIVWLHAELFAFVQSLSPAAGEHHVWLLGV
ncbi:MAG: hypothetical protein ACE5EC_05400, partial [Phycisphaerae bacterium]